MSVLFTEVLCGEIRVPENSNLIVKSGGLTPGSRTTFQCVPGYTIATGDNETRCSPDGQWDRPLPRCESRLSRSLTCAEVSDKFTYLLTAETY